MSREIWNEGRVVGLSTYELYVRHMMSEFPNEPIMSEKEWLASTLGDGVSLILKLNAGSEKGVHTFYLPSSTLCAATGAIVASLFNGTAEVDEDGWATKVTSYGPLLHNAVGDFTENPSELDRWDTENLHVIRDFLKVVDGVVFHNNITQDEPSQNYSPELNSTARATLRLRLSETLTTDVYILLTGFMNTSIVRGFAKFDSNPLNSPKPQQGDFLGPEVFPWGTKVIFSVHSEIYELISRYSYLRELPDGGTPSHVEAKSLIDFESVDPIEAYQNIPNTEEAMVTLDVKDINSVDDKGANVLAIYQKDTQNRYPAALYGARVRKTGVQQMAPIDVVSPGSVKVFEDRELAMNYSLVYPNLYGLYMDTDNQDLYLINRQIAESGQLPAPIGPKFYVDNLSGDEHKPKYATRTYKGNVEAPSEEVLAISLTDEDGQRLNTDGTSGDITDKDKIDWTTLLAALGTNQTIDLLGAALRYLRENGSVDKEKTRLTLKKSLEIVGGVIVGKDATYQAATEAEEFKFNKPMKSGADYITMQNGLRLYISSSAPDPEGVPVGSIGIGWTADEAE